MGAAKGALIATLPFAIANFIRNRRLRRLGGVEAVKAHTLGRRLLAESEMLRRYRGALHERLMQLSGGDPEALARLGPELMRQADIPWTFAERQIPKVDVRRLLERGRTP
jgi:hypothetical protein